MERTLEVMDTESSGNTTDRDQDQDKTQELSQTQKVKTSRVRRQNIKRKYDILNDDELNSSLSQADGEEQPKKIREYKRRRSVPLIDPNHDLRHTLDRKKTKPTISTNSSNSNVNSAEDTDSEFFDSRSTTSEEPVKIGDNPNEKNTTQANTREEKNSNDQDEINVDLNTAQEAWNTDGLDTIDNNFNEDINDRNHLPRRITTGPEYYRSSTSFVSSTPFVSKTTKKITKTAPPSMEGTGVSEEEYARLKEKVATLERELAESKKGGVGGTTKKTKNRTPRLLNVPTVPIRSLLTSPGVPGRITSKTFTEYVTSKDCPYNASVVGQLSVDEKTGKITGLNEAASAHLEDSRERAKLVAGAQAFTSMFYRELEIDDKVNAALKEVLSNSNKNENESLNAIEVSSLINKTLKGTLPAEIQSTIFNNTAATEECLTELQRTQEKNAMNTGHILNNERRIKHLESNSMTEKEKKKNLNRVIDEAEKEHRLVIKGHSDIASIRDMDPNTRKEKICDDLRVMDTGDHKINTDHIKTVFVSGNRQRNRGKGIVTVRFYNHHRGLSYQYIKLFKKMCTGMVDRPFEDIVEYKTMSEREVEGEYYNMVDEVAKESERIIKQEFKNYANCELALQKSPEEVARIMMRYDLRLAFRNGPRGGSGGPYVQTIIKPKDSATGGKFSVYTSQVKKSLKTSIASLKRMEKRQEWSRKEKEANGQAEDIMVVEEMGNQQSN